MSKDWYGDLDLTQNSRRVKKDSRDSSRESSSEEILAMGKLPFSMKDIGKDPRLVQLALHAARSIHQMQGVEFDESYPICMHSDLQISVVELKLPLGRK